jgi:hypothetical protein
LRGLDFAFGGLLLDGGVFGQRLRADIGGIELREALFQPEVGGPLVAKKAVALLDQ